MEKLMADFETDDSSFDRVVFTICSKEHLDVWKLTSSLLPQMLKADQYFVYVPEAEIELFQLHTNEKVLVRSQSSLGAGYTNKLAELFETHGNQSRMGWYLQQFYKLELVFQEPKAESIYIIWDADCVPTKSIKYVNGRDQLIYMKAAFEAHGPYFELIQRLLGLNKTVDLSFVIPSFPIFSSMAEELRRKIESVHPGMSWSDILLNEIDFSLRSGFSETELLGTWVSNMYPDRWSVYPGVWERRGQKRFGYARNMSPKKILKLGTRHGLDIVSFENWDTRGIRLVFKRIQELIRSGS